jgi:hypothetical protein
MAFAGVRSIGEGRIFGGEGECRSVLLRRRLYCLWERVWKRDPSGLGRRAKSMTGCNRFLVLEAWALRVCCKILDNTSLAQRVLVRQVCCMIPGNNHLAPAAWVLQACCAILDNMHLARGASSLHFREGCCPLPGSRNLELGPCGRRPCRRSLSLIWERWLEVEWGGSLPSG